MGKKAGRNRLSLAASIAAVSLVVCSNTAVAKLPASEQTTTKHTRVVHHHKAAGKKTQAEIQKEAAAKKIRAEIRVAVDRAQATYGVDANLLLKIASTESSFNPLAQKKDKDGHIIAEGLDQFVKGDIKEFNILNPYDIEESTDAEARKIIKIEKAFKARKGRVPSPEEIYFIHQQGDQGGPALLEAAMSNPDKPAAHVLQRAYLKQAKYCLDRKLRHEFYGEPDPKVHDSHIEKKIAHVLKSDKAEISRIASILAHDAVVNNQHNKDKDPDISAHDFVAAHIDEFGKKDIGPFAKKKRSVVAQQEAPPELVASLSTTDAPQSGPSEAGQPALTLVVHRKNAPKAHKAEVQVAAITTYDAVAFERLVFTRGEPKSAKPSTGQREDIAKERAEFAKMKVALNQEAQVFAQQEFDIGLTQRQS